MFKKATKTQIKLRLALTGPSGSGKTYSSLALASHLGKRIAVIDTEHGSASRYADLFEFDVVELESFHPNRYVKAIMAAQQAGYDVVVIDSLSHAWMGKDGELELVDRAKNSFAAWKDVRPLERALIDIALRKHVRTVFKCGIDTATKIIKFIPSLPHPILEPKPPMLDLIQVRRVGGKIPEFTSSFCNEFINHLRAVKTSIVNYDDIAPLQFRQQALL
jgi:hypothetical protein